MWLSGGLLWELLAVGTARVCLGAGLPGGDKGARWSPFLTLVGVCCSWSAAPQLGCLVLYRGMTPVLWRCPVNPRMMKILCNIIIIIVLGEGQEDGVSYHARRLPSR